MSMTKETPSLVILHANDSVASSSGTSSPALSPSTTPAQAPSLSALATASAKSRLLLFDVCFSGGRRVFRSGDRIAGWVTVETRGPVYATGYKIECVGYSELPPETSNGVSKQRLVCRRHLSIEENLLPGSRLVEKRSFEFQLPRWLPHSVECQEFGCVRYCCRAVVTFSLDEADGIEATQFFTLIEDVDLNAPAVAQRCTFDETSCTSVDRLINKLLKDEVKTSMMLKKDAYVPGEDVNCHLSVHCSSSTLPVQRIVLKLVQRATALGSNQRRLGSRNQVVLQEQVASLGPGKEPERFWSAKHKLHIPGVVATSLPNSHFQHPIAVEYAIQMCVTLGFSHVPVKDVTLGCPILIGTVPKLQPGIPMPCPEASFVEAINCAIPNSQQSQVQPLQQQQQQQQRRNSRGSFLASFNSKRSNPMSSGYRCPQVKYTLYCVYYPTIAIYRQKPAGSVGGGALKSF
ncbi:hypothetical protein BOX15_Mlig026047g2 [Macrostomum lignano]|uniref:Arrestin C-terminal-like domain-containing protein n=1 Tax=Macrostomum lignano TaxID=282301 RepID=A0A267EL06_9PLAT|nr:hypothetical protein BOX15_Mlig026047g2 [Macrostomum lignano]